MSTESTESTESLREQVAASWRTFKDHRPQGAYLPTGMLDGDCRECGNPWPCSTVLATPALAALVAERDALRAKVGEVRNLHQPVDVWQYDDTNGTFVTDEAGEKVLLTRLCDECSDDRVIAAVEDCQYREGWYFEVVPWPCPAIAALDGGA